MRCCASGSRRYANFLVEAGKVVEHGFNAFADAVVVFDQPAPRDGAFGQRRFGQARHDGRLRQQMRRGRRIDARRHVHHAHRIFHGHALRAAGLLVDLGAAQARQDQRGLAVHDVAAVELGGHVHGQVALAQAGPRGGGVGRGRCKVAAHGEEHARGALLHRLDGADGVVAVFARDFESKHLLQPIEEGRGWLLVNAHRAVALHVAVAAHRARTGARAPDVAAQEQQVDDHLDRRDRMLVLRDAHAPAGDDAAGLDVRVAGLADFVFRQARFGFDRCPRFGTHVSGEGVVAAGVLGDEGVVDDGR
ncbi:hypothetical protein COLO4_02540, partial [Corchorus olitorius]